MAVVGLGAMGSATVLALARAGARVLGIDRFAPPHPHGSTHGDTRITRLAVGEGPEHVPLAVRSHELWRDVEAQTGDVLLTVTGGVVLGSAGGRGMPGTDDFVAATAAAARAHGIAHEVLDAAALAERLPAFALRGDETGVFEPSAGFVRPERAVAAQLRLAREHGAELRTGERVLAAGGGRVATDAGTALAGTVVLTAGPWLGELRPRLAPLLTVTRQVLHWLALAPGAHEAHRELPVFIWVTGDGPEDAFYGFPALDGPHGGLKVATERLGPPTTPEAARRDVPPAESRAMHARFVAGRLPGVRPEAVRATTCLYTTTPDSRFVVDALPGEEDVLVVSACSGHGFKHSSAIGEAVAELALTGRSTLDLGPFALGRLA